MIVRDGEGRFVDLGGAPHDVKIARNMIVVANQASERVQLVKLDGTYRRRILLSLAGRTDEAERAPLPSALWLSPDDGRSVGQRR